MILSLYFLYLKNEKLKTKCRLYLPLKSCVIISLAYDLEDPICGMRTSVWVLIFITIRGIQNHTYISF